VIVDQPGERTESLRQLGEAFSVVDAVAANQAHVIARLDRGHAVAVHLLFVHPALSVEGAGDLIRVHQTKGDAAGQR